MSWYNISSVLFVSNDTGRLMFSNKVLFVYIPVAYMFLKPGCLSCVLIIKNFAYR